MFGETKPATAIPQGLGKLQLNEVKLSVVDWFLENYEDADGSPGANSGSIFDTYHGRWLALDILLANFEAELHINTIKEIANELTSKALVWQAKYSRWSSIGHYGADGPPFYYGDDSNTPPARPDLPDLTAKISIERARRVAEVALDELVATIEEQKPYLSKLSGNYPAGFEPPYSDEDEAAILRAANFLKFQIVEGGVLDLKKAEIASTGFQKIGKKLSTYAGEIGKKTVDEFAETFGKTLGTIAAGATGTTLWLLLSGKLLVASHAILELVRALSTSG